MNEASLIAKPIRPIAREQKRPIEIRHGRALRQEQGRGHGERCRHHASHHEREAKPFGLLGHCEGFGQPAGLVELDVDRVIPADQPRERAPRMGAFVGAYGDRTVPRA